MLRIAWANVNKGLRNPVRRTALQAWLDKNDIDVLFCQEPALRIEDIGILGFSLEEVSDRLALFRRVTLPSLCAEMSATFVQRVELGYAVTFNVYLDAYSSRRRLEQLAELAELLSYEDRDRPILVAGDFNLAPRPCDGLEGGRASAYNSAGERHAFRELLRDFRLVDCLAGEPLQFTVERSIRDKVIQFRCDLLLVSDYLTDFNARYDHAVRKGLGSFSDHSAVVCAMPVTLERTDVQYKLFEALDEGVSVSAHKTAMTRVRPSPVARFVVEGLLPAKDISRLLDYGCGRGTDVRFYRSNGISADGYDPYSPFGWGSLPEGTYDLVTLNFVLNVLPDPWLRARVMRAVAEFLAPSGILLVVARSPAEIGSQAKQGQWAHFNDGFWSDYRKGTFQKGISVEEIVAMAARVGLVLQKVAPVPDFGVGVSAVLLGREGD